APASPSRQARQTRPTALGRPRLPDRHRLRPAERHPLGDAPAGNGLWLRYDVLAQAAVLAAPGRLEETPACPPPAGRAGEGHRLGAVLRGQPDFPRRFWG